MLIPELLEDQSLLDLGEEETSMLEKISQSPLTTAKRGKGEHQDYAEILSQQIQHDLLVNRISKYTNINMASTYILKSREYNLMIQKIHFIQTQRA